MKHLFALVFVCFLAQAASAASLDGYVYDSSGKPVPGASITAYAAESTAEKLQRWRSSATRAPETANSQPVAAVTDESGRFVLASLPPRVVELIVISSGFAPAFQLHVPGDSAPSFTLEPAKPVQGRVVDEAQKPVAGTNVVWMQNESFDLTFRTDADGRYSVPDPRRWATSVVLFHPEYAPARPSRDRGQPEATTLRIERGVPLNGIVVDEAGRPIPKVRVEVDGLSQAMTTDEGRFTISNAPRDPRLLRVIGDGVAAEVPRPRNDLRVVAAAARTIEGTVLLRKASGAAPLAGAPVRIHALRGEESEALIAVSDTRGRYSLGGLASGRYVVMPAGGVETRLRTDQGPSMVMEMEGPAGIDLRTSLRGRKDIELTRPPIVSGRVLNASGEPVGGVAIQIVPEGVPDAHVGVDRTTPRSGADGRFSLPVMWIEGPQKIQLLAIRAGHSHARSEAVKMESGAETRVDVRLPEETVVRGRVVNETGEPIAGAAISFARVDDRMGYDQTTTMITRTHRISATGVESSPSGEFTLHLSPGSYELAAGAADYQLKTISGFEVTRNPSTLTIALDLAAALRGRVLRGGEPVPGVHVAIQSERVPEASVTAADGTFSVPNLAPGTYQLGFLKHEELVQEQRTVKAPDENILVELPPGGGISGQVVDASSGQPVGEYFLQIGKTTSGSSLPRDRSFVARESASHKRVTSHDGKFEFAVLPEGEYEIQVTSPGYVSSAPVTVQIIAGETRSGVRIPLDRGSVVSGRVTDERGNALADAHVTVAAADSSRARMERTATPQIPTNENGMYSLSGVEPGPSIVSIRRQGFIAFQKEIEIAGETRVDAQLSRGLSVTGYVRQNGRAVAGAQVGAAGAAIGAEHQSATTDESGRFVMQGLLPARYTFSAFKEGFPHAEVKNVDVVDQREVIIELDQQNRGTIYGTVLGIPAPRPGEKIAMLSASAIGSDHGAEAQIDPSGAYRIENAPTGTVRVTARMDTSHGSRSTAEKVVQVTAGGEVRADLEFVDALTVQGRVMYEGQEVKRGRVNFMGEGSLHASSITDDAGHYRIVLPGPGTYQVFAHSEGIGRLQYQTVRTLTGSETFDIDISDTSIDGRVVDAVTKEPVAGAIVSLLSVNQEIVQRHAGGTRTNGQGIFSFVTATSGAHELMVEAPGYGQQLRAISIGATPHSGILVELERVESLRLRAVDASRGTPLETYFVIRDDSSRLLQLRPERRADGSQSYSLKPGRYVVTAVVPGFANHTMRVTAPGDVEMRLEPGGSVVFESNEPLRGRVKLRDRAGVEILPCCHTAWWSLTGARTLIDNLAAGSYTAEIIDMSGEVLHRAPVTILSGQTTTVRLGSQR